MFTGALEPEDSSRGETGRPTDLQNAQDRPLVPNGERVAVKSVWGVEFYSSTQTEHLIGRLRSLGWERDADRFSPPPFSDWLHHSRYRRGSWRTIGKLVTDPQERDTKVYPTALPSGVRNGHAFLATLTPSLKALCVHFIFDEESGQRFQKAMKAASTPARTRRGPVGGTRDPLISITTTCSPPGGISSSSCLDGSRSMRLGSSAAGSWEVWGRQRAKC